jgi:hypothetical protein
MDPTAMEKDKERPTTLIQEDGCLTGVTWMKMRNLMTETTIMMALDQVLLPVARLRLFCSHVHFSRRIQKPMLNAANASSGISPE